MTHDRKTIVILLFVAVILGAMPGWAVAGEDAANIDGSEYLCRPLDRVLEDLGDRGLRLIYSSDLVRPDLQVKRVPEGPAAPGELLAALLEPHGLIAREAEGGRWLVVPGGPGQGPRRSSSSAAGGPLPAWIALGEGGGDLVEVDFPGEELPKLTATSRYLVVHLRPEALGETAVEAYRLKDLIVAAGSTSPELIVALDGPLEVVEALVEEGLAPYVDAYVRHSDFTPPDADPTGRTWWRSRAQGAEVLERLLEGSAQGDQLVMLEGTEVNALHRAFLERLAATPSAPLEVQPRVMGLGEGARAFFFLDPEHDAHYLAVYAGESEERRLRFDLHRELDVHLLFPRGATYSREGFGTHLELELEGEVPYYLFALLPRQRDAVSSALTVEGEEVVDPYEVVVKNQIFQRLERRRVDSLDVMEYLSVTSSNPSSDQLTWEHRIIERRNKLSEFHHLGLLRNGVRVPQDRLLKGRIFRSEALVQLHPLEIELDATYRYSYLGREWVDGHSTWKIGFEPLRRGSTEDGTFVSGLVWVDTENYAHRRLRTFQRGLDSIVVSVERTTHFDWVPDGGECYWSWRFRDGSNVTSFFGEQESSRYQVLRQDFRFNRPDLEDEMRRAYASDILIHVETPPEGHRWLVKRDGKRWLGGFTDGREAPEAASVEEPKARPTAASGESVQAESQSVDDYGGRELADVHDFSTRAAFSLGGFGSGDEDLELFPGIVITDTDLFDRGYVAYAGVFRREALFALSNPSAFTDGGRRRGVHFDTFLRLPYSSRVDERIGIGADGLPRVVDLDTWQPTLTLSLSAPVARRLTFTGRYRLRQLEISRTGATALDFVMPTDTTEHGLDAELAWRGESLALGVGLETGHRENWRAWGLPGALSRRPDYRVLRLESSWFKRLEGNRGLALELGYWRGWDLDRFSRLPEGRTRAVVAGFAAEEGFDEAFRLSVGHGLRLGSMPLHLRLDMSRQRILEGANPWRDLVGIRARFLVHGPWRLDLWPSVAYGIYSSVEDEAGDVIFGLTVERRQ